jgi:hypothetical protein
VVAPLVQSQGGMAFTASEAGKVVVTPDPPAKAGSSTPPALLAAAAAASVGVHVVLCVCLHRASGCCTAAPTSGGHFSLPPVVSSPLSGQLGGRVGWLVSRPVMAGLQTLVGNRVQPHLSTVM